MFDDLGVPDLPTDGALTDDMLLAIKSGDASVGKACGGK